MDFPDVLTPLMEYAVAVDVEVDDEFEGLDLLTVGLQIIEINEDITSGFVQTNNPVLISSIVEYVRNNEKWFGYGYEFPNRQNGKWEKLNMKET